MLRKGEAEAPGLPGGTLPPALLTLTHVSFPRAPRVLPPEGNSSSGHSLLSSEFRAPQPGICLGS